MKCVVSFCLLLVLIVGIFPVYASAAECSEQVVYFEDGSYLTITLEEYGSRASGTKSGSKKYAYTYDGATAWQAVLSGTFTYTGLSATCTSSSCSVTISDSAWYTISKSAGKSGNSATATVTMGRKVTGVTVDKYTANITLSCDANGNLS